MAQTYNRVAVWGSGLRPRAVASAEIALPPSAYNTTRLQGTNRKQWPAPHPMRGGDFRSSTFAGAPVARGSSARALPPDVYNLGRLSGGNKRVAPVGQPRTPATRAALMRGDATTEQLSTKAKTSKAKADAPQSSFDINEIVAGLRAALESSESDGERDILNEQLATLRPFVLLSKKRPLTDEEQSIVDEIGRALLAQAESAVKGEVAADSAQRIAYDADQRAAGDVREYLAELERVAAQKADIAARRAHELDLFAEEAKDRIGEIAAEATDLRAEEARAAATQADVERRLKEIPTEERAAQQVIRLAAIKVSKKVVAPDAKAAAEADASAAKAALKDLALEEKALAEQDAELHSIQARAATRAQELADEEAAIRLEVPRLEAVRDLAIQEAKDAGDALLLTPQPEAKVPRKRARNVPMREDAARQQQIEILEEALNPLSTNIKRALFEMGQAQQGQAQAGPPPQYISSWTEKSIMAPVNEGASTVPILKGVLKKALGSIGTNRQGNAPNKKELFALIRKNGLAQELADAVIAAGR